MIDGAAHLRTALALGPRNLLDVALYRLSLKLRPSALTGEPPPTPRPPFFDVPDYHLTSRIDSVPRSERTLLFGHHEVMLGDDPPSWFSNPQDPDTRFPERERPWWKIADFDPRVGDIKAIWELSRFDWVLVFAQQARAGNDAIRPRLDHWLTDWAAENPPYQGPNWKCAQEAAIRVLHLAAADLIMGGPPSQTPGLLDLVEAHLRRIARTTSYARAQDNNHGTSEAAALFVGGHWLAATGRREGARLALQGRSMLEERVAHLVMVDGTFSQYSTTYHRMMLDTLSFTEAWRRRLDLPAFSPRFLKRAGAAVRWLERLTSVGSGDAPNIGANDGSHILNLTDRPHRDFRPSVQLGAILFLDQRAYEPERELDAPARWLGIDLDQVATAPPHPLSDAGASGGFTVLARGRARAVLRVPRFRFRPSQADALHLDLWIGDHNLVRDGGTYSYNADPQLTTALAGGPGHSTVQFDNRDQMPRLGRFLFGNWLRPSKFSFGLIDEDPMNCRAAYVDSQGACHERELLLAADRLEIIDHVSGFRSNAVLRWRLAPGNWLLEGDRVTDGTYSLAVESNTPLISIALRTGWESRLYSDRSRVSVLEVEVREAATLKTAIDWPA